MKAKWLALSLVLLAVPVGAQEEAPPDTAGASALPTPPLVQSPVTGEAVEPDITIQEKGGELIYEYRVRGKLYMVRIQPQFGPPYYLLDLNGDGLMDVRRDPPNDQSVQQWVLFSWD